MSPCNIGETLPNRKEPFGYDPLAVNRKCPANAVTAFIGTRRSMEWARTTASVKGFGRLRTKASSAGTRGPHALVYG